jgi:hypothetical protein
MSFTLKYCLFRRAFLTRLLQTTGLSLALSATTLAEIVVIISLYRRDLLETARSLTFFLPQAILV